MTDAQLIDWPRIREAPVDIRRRLRAIRPDAELLWHPFAHQWMLGEVRPNGARYRMGARIIQAFLNNRREVASAEEWESPEQICFLFDGWLAIQGFVWIRNYDGDPTGRIVHDYERMCWKERHGLLDADFAERMTEADGTRNFARRLATMRDKLYATQDDFRNITRKRVLSRPH